MKHSHGAYQSASTPFDQFEDVRGVVAVDIGMPEIFDGSAIAGLGNGQQFEVEFVETRERDARILFDFAATVKLGTAQFRTQCRHLCARVSGVVSVKRDDPCGVTAFPRMLPIEDSLASCNARHESECACSTRMRKAPRSGAEKGSIRPIVAQIVAGLCSRPLEESPRKPGGFRFRDGRNVNIC